MFNSVIYSLFFSPKLWVNEKKAIKKRWTVKVQLLVQLTFKMFVYLPFPSHSPLLFSPPLLLLIFVPHLLFFPPSFYSSSPCCCYLIMIRKDRSSSSSTSTSSSSPSSDDCEHRKKCLILFKTKKNSFEQEYEIYT